MAIFFADATDGLAGAAGVGLVGDVLDIGSIIRLYAERFIVESRAVVIYPPLDL
jgi:hypothetical protein